MSSITSLQRGIKENLNNYVLRNLGTGKLGNLANRATNNKQVENLAIAIIAILQINRAA